MDKYLSKKLTFFSFWLMGLVVLLHSLNVDFPACNNLICSLQYLLSHRLSQIAVPLFFMMSGYLYFLRAKLNHKIDLSFFIDNNKKRIKTVLVPYILWCTLWFFFMYIIQNLPIVENYFPQPLHEMSTKDKLLNLYYYPLNYPFWFLRELMVLFIISPFIFMIVKYLKLFIVVLIVIAALMSDKLLSFYDITLLSTKPFIYFVLGAFFALNKTRLIFNTKKSIALLLIFVWLLLNVISLYNLRNSFIIESMVQVFSILKDFIGCMAVWYLYDFLNQKTQWRNYEFYNYSFFIFAFHGIPTLILVKISSILFKDHSFLLFIAYLFIVPFIIILSIFIGTMTRKMFPYSYKILVGTRK